MDVPQEIQETMQIDGQFVTSFVVIYETSDGQARQMNLGFSDGMTTWLAEGMVNYAQRHIWSLGGTEINEDDY